MKAITIKKLKSKDVDSVLDKYGFIELGYICEYISAHCKEELSFLDCYFIRLCLRECLNHHDNDTDYFIPLRELDTQLLDFI